MAIGIGLAIAGIAGAGASIFGGAEQANASQNAINAQRQEQQQGQQFLTSMFNTGLGVQQNDLSAGVNALAPYAAAGTTPLSWYNYMTGTGPLPGSQGATATAPTGTVGQNTATAQSGNVSSGAPGNLQSNPFSPQSMSGAQFGSYNGSAQDLYTAVNSAYQSNQNNVQGFNQALLALGLPQNTVNQIITGGPSQFEQGVLNPLIQQQQQQQAPAAPAGPPPTDAQGNPLPQSYNPTTAPLTAPFTAASLASTPGYQFALSQGLMGTNNANVAMGLGGSGAEAKALTGYASGQAQQVYNSQFQNYLAQNQQIANMLLAPAQLGAGAAGGIGSLFGAAGNQALASASGVGNSGNVGAVTTGQGIATSTAGIGNAIAGGAVGATGSLSNALLQYNILNALKGGSTQGGTVGPSNNYVGNSLISQGAVPADITAGYFNYGGQ
jgi:hypothetical protein